MTYTNWPNGTTSSINGGLIQLTNTTAAGSTWNTWAPTTMTGTTSATTTSMSFTLPSSTFTYPETNWYWNGGSLAINQFLSWSQTPPPSPADRIREMIRRRLAPAVIGSRCPAPTAFDDREARARDTLRRVVGEEKYRRFLRDGWVSVRARSGRTYVVGHGMTRVFEKGREVDRLCVVLRGAFPPTDVLITRYLMLLNDEAEFVRLAVKHGRSFQTKSVVATGRVSLVDEARLLRTA